MDLLKIFTDSFHDNWDDIALTQYETGLELHYSALASRIGRVHMLLKLLNIESGNHMAVIGHNSIDWITNYVGSLIYGCVTVTIPMSHHIDEIIDMLNQVDTEILFIDANQFNNDIDMSLAPSIRLVISNDTSRVLYCRHRSKSEIQNILDTLDIQFQTAYPAGFIPGISNIQPISSDAPAAIFFTSGTVGKPKPVLLTSDNIEGNLIYGIKKSLAPRHSTVITSTKMGTVWGTIFNILVPLVSGAKLEVFSGVYDVDKLVAVFKKVKPVKLMLSSLMVARLYRYARRHHENKSSTRFLKRLPGGNFISNILLRRSIRKILGSRCIEVMVGYVMMNNSVAYKLMKAGLPITVVYGLTECGGLVGYMPAANFKAGTSGRAINSLIKSRVRPFSIPCFPDNAGLLEVKGMTVMKKYYNDDEATRKAFTSDGWLSTGDIATMNENGDITVMGRINTLIHLSRGTISPEHIQLCLYEQPCINNAIVIGKNDKLVAIIYPDYEEIARKYGKHNYDIKDIINNAVAEVNSLLPLIDHIDEVIVSTEQLNLTAKGTVARDFYTNITD